MTNTIYFFAAKSDLYSIFKPIETEFEIKYCANYVYAQAGQEGADQDKQPRIAFHTIEEIADSDGALFYIVPKAQDMHTICQVLQNEARVRYITSCRDNEGRLTFRTKRSNPNGYECDYEVYIPREYETEFTGALFKRIVREVKRNCVRVKNITPFYVGKDLYQNVSDYVFYTQNNGFPQIVTDTNETKRWWDNPDIRQMMEQPIPELLPFLQEVFVQKRLKNFDPWKVHWKDYPEDYEIYNGILYRLWTNKDLSLFKNIAALFDDSVTMSDLQTARTAMETLREIELDWAFSQKGDGIRLLLENLKNVPSAGYHCGNEELVRALLKKKYFGLFRESLPQVTDETKALVRSTLKAVSDKRLQKNLYCSKLSYYMTIKKQRRTKNDTAKSTSQRNHDRTFWKGLCDCTGDHRKRCALCAERKRLL